MDTSVSPLPLPLWPMLALSLSLFGVTAAAVTVSAHYTKQLYFNPANDAALATPPVSANDLLQARRAEANAHYSLF